MRFLILLPLCLLAATDSFAGFFQNLFRHDVHVITTTDVSKDGALLPPASKENPVYYITVNAGYKDFGGIIAGDKLPAEKDILRTTAKILTAQGYIPASQQHPPTQILIITWGTMYNDEMDMGNPDMPPVQLNREQKLRFMGGEKLKIMPDATPFGYLLPIFGAPSRVRDPVASAVDDFSQDNLYIVAIGSYEYAALKQGGKPKLLWKTRISCPSNGLVMDKTLPLMVAIAAPNIGRETATPVWVNASDKFKAEVKVGDPIVEEYIDSDRATVIKVGK